MTIYIIKFIPLRVTRQLKYNAEIFSCHVYIIYRWFNAKKRNFSELAVELRLFNSKP